jgi:alpha-1,6-mannosyltransferase
MKICDLTQFYSPLGGGVKRYLHEKIRYVRSLPNDEHVLIVPGAKTERTEEDRLRVYTIASPLLSTASRYRALLNLRAVGEILDRERPDLIESADPYQVGWKAVASGRALGIPVVGFYHSHFPEAYLRGSEHYFGRAGMRLVIDLAQRYVRELYNRCEATLVPSAQLGEVLGSWGVNHVRAVELGVDPAIFRPQPNDASAVRESLGIPSDRILLLYVGRLAQEKNTQTLFQAFAELMRRDPERFHLLVVGDGLQRTALQKLQVQTEHVTWRPYCTDPAELAKLYRAADLLVHPGVQETFGLTSLESQACGTPVVGIRGSYMDRIIFTDQSCWARENSPSALAGAVEEMSRLPLREMGKTASRRALASYAWPCVFDRLFCIYRDVRGHYRNS